MLQVEVLEQAIAVPVDTGIAGKYLSQATAALDRDLKARTHHRMPVGKAQEPK